MSVPREMALTAGAAVIFGGAILSGLDWELPAAMFPMTIGVVGLALTLWAAATDLMKWRENRDIAAPMSAEDRARARGSFIWIGVFFGAVLLIGFQWGLSLAALAFYRLEARLGWIAAVLSAAACGAFLYIAAHALSIPLYVGFIPDLIQ